MAVCTFVLVYSRLSGLYGRKTEEVDSVDFRVTPDEVKILHMLLGAN
jgi:hypothetical protein